MSKLYDYQQVFITTFSVTEDQLKDLKYQDIVAWDSVGHMQLMSALEDVFDIMIEVEDMIDFSSFEKGKEILLKYGVEING